MPKYEWYFVNKDDDVCKHATSDVRNSVVLNLAIVLDGLHAMVTWGAYSLIWPMRGCAAGQSVDKVQNLDTLDTNEPLLKGI